MEKLIVFIPCYNAEKYIAETLESMISQSYHKFKIVIIDDGSTDGSRDIIRQYALRDSRIVLIENGQNRGVVYTRNRGIKLCECEYLAFMDADDIAPGDRLKTQVEFLDQHKQIDAVGGKYQLVDEDGKQLETKLKTALSDGEIRAGMLFFNPLANGSMMLRRKVVLDHKIQYRDRYTTLEDYRFWCDFLEHGTINNLDRILQYYRISSTSISRKERKEDIDKRNQNFDEIHELLYTNMNLRLSEKNKAVLKKATHDTCDLSGWSERIRFLNTLCSLRKQGKRCKNDFGKALEKNCSEIMSGEVRAVLRGIRDKWL